MCVALVCRVLKFVQEVTIHDEHRQSGSQSLGLNGVARGDAERRCAERACRVWFTVWQQELETTLQDLGLLSVTSSNLAQWTSTRARVWRSLQADASQHLHSAKTCKLIARRGPTTTKKGMEGERRAEGGDYVSVCVICKHVERHRSAKLHDNEGGGGETGTGY